MSDDDKSEGGRYVYDPIPGGHINKSVDKEPVNFEGRVEHQTEKAYLVEPTVFSCSGKDGMLWVPKSQVLKMTSTGDKTYEFTVKEWWWGKQVKEGVIDA